MDGEEDYEQGCVRHTERRTIGRHSWRYAERRTVSELVMGGHADRDGGCSSCPRVE